MASILPFQVIEWEKLFWFLKFLIPKLPIKDKDDDGLDELLESVDLSTYGLERVTLNHSIGLDDSDSELEPSSERPGGVFDDEEEKDPLDLIIRSFNERWFQGWDATPESQRVKIISLSKSIQAHPDFESKVANNTDEQNKDLALKRILDEVMSQQRRQELNLYRLYAKDESFYQSLFDTMKRMTRVTNL